MGENLAGVTLLALANWANDTIIVIIAALSGNGN